MESFRDNKWLSRSLVIAWCVAALCATDFFPPLNDMLSIEMVKCLHRGFTKIDA